MRQVHRGAHDAPHDGLKGDVSVFSKLAALVKLCKKNKQKKTEEDKTLITFASVSML